MNPQPKRSKIVNLRKDKLTQFPFTDIPSPDFGIFFQYSPEISLVTAWHGDVDKLLGTTIDTLSQHGDLFLKYTHENDKFKVLDRLDDLIKGKSNLLSITYRWLYPKSNTFVTLHCKAEKRISGLIEGVILGIETEDMTPQEEATAFKSSKV